MSILNIFRKSAAVGEVIKTGKKFPVRVVGGKTCPKCGEFGLFHYEAFSQCESCLIKFDKEMKEMK